MKSTPFYVPVSPSYACNVNANISQLNSSEQSLGSLTLPGFDATSRIDPLDAFIEGKQKILAAGIEQILHEIDEREKLKNRLVEDIDIEICVQRSLLVQVAPHGSAPMTIGDPRRRSAIERTLAELESEKRREESSSWKDIAGLKRELRELIREYHEEKRKGLMRE